MALYGSITATYMNSGRGVGTLGALVANVCPDPAMFDMLGQAVVDEPPALTDAAAMLRRFNELDGVAHTSDDLADRADADAANLTPEDAVVRFSECARILRATTMSEETAITYPVVGLPPLPFSRRRL